MSRRILEILTYLATNHLAVANILFYFDIPSAPESLSPVHLETKKERGKEKIIDGMTTLDQPDISLNRDIPLILFLKLLRRPLFLRSSAHLEQVLTNSCRSSFFVGLYSWLVCCCSCFFFFLSFIYLCIIIIIF